MRRAFLFGLATQLLIVAAVFLVFDDLMLPMTRSPVIGLVALLLAAASAVFAWKSMPHPTWPGAIGLWLAGFLSLYAAIPVFEMLFVLGLALTPG